MTQTAGYKSAWANGSLFEGIAEDFLALLDAHDPQTDRLKAAFLIRKNIGADGISLGILTLGPIRIQQTKFLWSRCKLNGMPPKP